MKIKCMNNSQTRNEINMKMHVGGCGNIQRHAVSKRVNGLRLRAWAYGDSIRIIRLRSNGHKYEGVLLVCVPARI